MLSRQLKYVITKDFLPVLFTDGQQHSEYAHLSPVSAGMVRLDYSNDGVTACTGGKSLGLGLEPADGDEALIEAMFKTG